MTIEKKSPTSFLTGLAGQLSVAGVIGGIALLASTVLSVSGIYFSLAGSALGEVARFIIAFISTLFLTLMAFQAWLLTGRKARERKLRKHHPALPNPRVWRTMVMGAVLTSLSVLTATTALLFLNNREGVQAMMNQSAFAATIQPVDGLTTDMAAISAVAAQASATANERSQRESAIGGTCGISAPGEGPLTRLRASTAQQASDIAGRAAALKAQASTITRTLVTATDQAMVNTQFAAARELALNPQRLAIANEADSLARGYGSEGFLFEGKTRHCNDPDLAALFAQISTAAHAVVDLPLQPPLRRDVKIFDAFAVVMPILLDDEIGRSVGITRANILPFVFFAVLVDLVSVGGAIAHGAGRAVRMTPAEQDKLHRTAWIMRNFVRDFPPVSDQARTVTSKNQLVQAFVHVPLGGSPERTRQAEFLTSLFGLSVDPEHQFEPLESYREEDDAWVSQMRLASGNATHYALYPITSQEVYDQIMTMRRAPIRVCKFSVVYFKWTPD